MAKDHRPSLTLSFAVIVSAFGLLTTLAFTLLPTTPIDSLPWRKPLIGTIFVVICASGGLASLFPRKCSEQFDLQEDEGSTASNKNSYDLHLIVKGHHPNCREFSAHVIQARGHTLCAACTGLFLGALIAILGAVLSFFLGLGFQSSNYLFVLIGLICVVIGFFQLRFRGVVRSTLNALFVVGAYLVLAGVDMLSKNVFLDIYLIGLICFWIWTRILLSQWDHAKICHSCRHDCELKGKKAKLVSAS